VILLNARRIVASPVWNGPVPGSGTHSWLPQKVS
jgi:hypothetical protein